VFSIHLIAVFNYIVIMASFKRVIIIVEMNLRVGPQGNWKPAVVMFQFAASL